MTASEPADSNEPMQPAEPSSAPRRPRLRWYQFSLRGLLIFMLLASVGLSWFGVKYRRAERQRKFVEAIRKAGGLVYYQHELDCRGRQHSYPPPGPVWLRQIVGDDFLASIRRVTFTDHDLSAEALAFLATWDGCEELCAYCVTDAGLERIRKWTRL